MPTKPIAAVRAEEILDSRGNPTLAATVTLADGTQGRAAAPSGASTGALEAVERRDGDPSRYRGRGVIGAVAAVEGEIAAALLGRDARDQAGIDHSLVALDGTPGRSRLGGNAIVAVSMAVARAAAAAHDLPLYLWLGGCDARRLPMPMMNVLNGGKHADSGLAFQEFMVVPVGAASFAEALRWGAETYQALRDVLHEGGHSVAVGDEGGFAPRLAGDENACEAIVTAIARAGYRPGQDIAIALDPAATSFHSGGAYDLSRSGKGRLDAAGMTALYGDWVARYPIVSIEDGLAEDDWDGFSAHTAALGATVQVVGDDLYVTNTDLIRRGIAEHSTNAVLIKPNQVGTVTETLAAVALCRRAGWGFVVSHRSGETEDAFIADLAVALGGGQIKAGAPARGERVAKYNRLLSIERELGAAALFTNPYF